MTQKEFEERVKCEVTADEFSVINNLYMATEMDKDEFCKEFKEMCGGKLTEIRKLPKEIFTRIYAMSLANQELVKSIKQQYNELAEFLIGKAHTYDDTDFRNQALKLVTEMDVVKLTIELGFPLWDEDRKYILSLIESQRI